MSKINSVYSCKKSYRPCAKRARCDQVVPTLTTTPPSSSSSASSLTSSSSKNQNFPLGYFDLLPLEIKFVIFSKITALELSYLTITSKAMRNLVELYRKSEKGVENIFTYPFAHSKPAPVDEVKYLKQFRDIGLLLKRSTCLYSTKDRLNLILTFLKKFQCNLHYECCATHSCISLTCYGMILHTIIAGWDDKECTKAFEAVCHISCMDHFFDYLKIKSNGFSSEFELHVRYFFRRVFFNNFNSKAEKAFWLSLLLKRFSGANRAQIIFLLFGPSTKDGVQWFEVCESTPANKEQTVLCFGNISNALLLLTTNSTEWNENDIIDIFNNLISYPEEWLSENVASLLFLLGQGITEKVLMVKANQGKIAELSYLISSLSIVCHKQNHPMTFIVNLIRKVMSTFNSGKSQKNFLHSVIDMFREVTFDIFDLGEPIDDETMRDVHTLLNTQASLSKEIILLAFKDQLIVDQPETKNCLKSNENDSNDNDDDTQLSL